MDNKNPLSIPVDWLLRYGKLKGDPGTVIVIKEIISIFLLSEEHPDLYQRMTEMDEAVRRVLQPMTQIGQVVGRQDNNYMYGLKVGGGDDNSNYNMEEENYDGKGKKDAV